MPVIDFECRRQPAIDRHASLAVCQCCVVYTFDVVTD